jgi:hypothetical protein
MKRGCLLNRRVVLKLRGMDPLDATILKEDETGYWVRGATLAGQFEQTNCSVPESDVRYLDFTRIEWVRALRGRAG